MTNSRRKNNVEVLSEIGFQHPMRALMIVGHNKVETSSDKADRSPLTIIKL